MHRFLSSGVWGDLTDVQQYRLMCLEQTSESALISFLTEFIELAFSQYSSTISGILTGAPNTLFKATFSYENCLIFNAKWSISMLKSLNFHHFSSNHITIFSYNNMVFRHLIWYTTMCSPLLNRGFPISNANLTITVYIRGCHSLCNTEWHMWIRVGQFVGRILRVISGISRLGAIALSRVGEHSKKSIFAVLIH